MEAMKPQKSSGSLLDQQRARRHAVDHHGREHDRRRSGPPGTPSASIGTKAPEVAALFADSGPATPATAPWPNSSGCFESFRSTA